MAKDAVSFEVEGKVGIITLNHPTGKAVVTSDVAAAFSDIRQQVGYGSDVAALVITAEGANGFSIGADADEISGYETPDELLAGMQTASIVASFDRPTLAVINGDAFDQGLEIALACDLRIASESTRFAMSQVSRGSLPWDGGTQRLSRLVGKGNALELILLGKTIDAQGALRIGLISRAVPSESLLASGLELAQELAGKGPIALRYAKEAIHKGMDMTLDQGLRLEADLYFLLHTTEDRTEGINAFREKRDPVFKGK